MANTLKLAAFTVLLSVPISMALGALMAWITVTGDLLRSGSQAVLVTWPLLLLFSVWGIVGCWRAALPLASLRMSPARLGCPAYLARSPT